MRAPSLYARILILMASALPATAVSQPGLTVFSRPAPVHVMVSVKSDTAQHPVAPGARVTIPFEIVNRSSADVAVRARVLLPAGWRQLGEETRVLLAAGASDVRLIQVVAPPGAKPARYGVEYQLVDDPGSTVLASSSAFVKVSAEHRLSARVAESPIIAIAGDPYEIRFEVSNAGNVGTDLRVSARSGSGFRVAVDTIAFLGAGESRTVTARVSTSHRAEGAVTNRVELTATAPSGAVAKAASTVRVAARAGVDQAPVHLLPGSLRLVSAPQRPGSQPAMGGFELFASGPIREDGSTSVAITARGPRPTSGMFGDREEYRVHLSSPAWSVTAGDQHFSLTTLTEGGRRGSGARASGTIGPMTAEAVVGGLRAEPGDFTGSGLRIGMRPDAGLELGLNYLARRHESPVATISADWTPHSLFAVHAEGGRTTDALQARGADAVAATLRGRSPLFSYSLRVLAADSAYPGQYRGSSTTDASLTITPTGWLRLGARLNDSRRTMPALIMPIDGESAVTETRSARTMEGTIGLRGLVNGALRRVSRERGGIFGESSATETGARLRVTPIRGRMSLQLMLEGGATETDVSSVARSFAGGGVYGSLRVDSRQSFHASVERSTGARWYLPAPMTQTVGGFGLSSTGYRGFSTQLSVQGTRTTGAGGTHTAANADGILSYAPRNGHELALRLRTYGAIAGEPQLPSLEAPWLQLSYSLPLGIPLSRSRNVGRVIGHVSDLETGAPVRDVLVQIGGAAVLSDERGRVVFSRVAPDSHLVRVDISSVGRGRALVGGSEMPIAVAPGRTSRFELEMTRPATLAGVVTAYDGATKVDRAPAALRSGGGVGGAVVEAVRDGVSRRGTADSAGFFHIAGLVPGEWTVRLVENTLGADRQAENDGDLLRVEAGDSTRIELRTIPRQRVVVAAGGGEIAALQSAAVPAARSTSGASPQPVAPPRLPQQVAAPERTNAYTVTRWDTSLQSIARAVYGDAALWPKLWFANRHQMANPASLRPGMRLVVPMTGPLTPDELRATSTLDKRHDR